MRHRKAGRKFGRQSGPRHALMRGLVANLVRYERIRTTDAKARELRRFAERTITWGTSVAELIERAPETLVDHERARIVHAMRMARRMVAERDVLHKLFHEVAPRYQGRPGGYTRIIKLGNRPGDAAPMSYIELIPGPNGAPGHAHAEGEESGKGKKKAEAKAKTAEPAPKAKAKAAAEPRADKGAKSAKGKGSGEARATKSSAKGGAKKKKSDKDE